MGKFVAIKDGNLNDLGFIAKGSTVPASSVPAECSWIKEMSEGETLPPELPLMNRVPTGLPGQGNPPQPLTVNDTAYNEQMEAIKAGEAARDAAKAEAAGQPAPTAPAAQPAATPAAQPQATPQAAPAAPATPAPETTGEAKGTGNADVL